MDPKTRELISRLFIADASEATLDEYADAVGALRDHLEETGQWRWSIDAEPLIPTECAHTGNHTRYGDVLTCDDCGADLPEERGPARGEAR